MAFYKEFSPALLDTVILLYSPAVDRDIAGGLGCYSIVCCQPILCDVRLWRGPPAFNMYKHRLPVKLCEIQNYLQLDFNGQFIQSWFHILLNYSAWRVSSPKLGQKHTFSHLAMQKIHSRRWQQFEMIFRHCRQWGLQDRTQEFHFGTRCCCFVFLGAPQTEFGSSPEHLRKHLEIPSHGWITNGAQISQIMPHCFAFPSFTSLNAWVAPKMDRL